MVVRRAPAGHRAMHRGTTRSEHRSNHQMRWTPSGPSATSPPPSLHELPANSTRAWAVPRAPGGACHGGGNRAVTSPPGVGQSTSCSDVKSSFGGGRWVGQEWVRTRGAQERQQTGGGATQPHKTREPHHEGRGRVQQTRRRGAARQGRQPGQWEQGTRK